MDLLGRRILLLAMALVLTASAGGQASSSGLASHRAIYHMSLKSAGHSSDIAELSGQMLIEIVDVCDGWTLKQRIALSITNFAGGVVNSYTSFTSWESKDGRRFRFEQKTRRDDMIVEELGGKASLEPNGGGVVVLSKPEALNLELAPGTLLPSQHMALMIASAEAGEIFFNRTVFDGTSKDGPNRVSAFIGAPTIPPRLAGEAAAPPVWPIRLAFYRALSTTSEPDVEIGMMLQANGVTRNLTLDYGSFAIAGRLDKLELLPATAC